DAYDCVYVIKQAIEKSSATADLSVSDLCDKLVEAITSSDFTYDGLTGTGMTWSDTGEVSKAPKGMVIKNGAYAAM
ncbi:MAG: amino acid ABC transporter substrate-binding protein, partial [Atopobiaceae bacterium]|nr:amino acid ABC transporter substrate-binding protein [Atopobiaceae bacterium]